MNGIHLHNRGINLGICFLIFASQILSLMGSDSVEHFELICNQRYFPALQSLIMQATESIHITALSINSKDEKIQRIIEALVAAKKRGVDVKVVYEGDHGWAADQNAKAMRLLQEHGIEARPDSDNHLTHAKLVIIDGYFVLIGSTNLTQNSMDKNNESNLLVRSSEIAGFYSRFFQNLWNYPEKPCPMQQTSSSGKTTCFSDSAFLKLTREMIDQAGKEINLAMYMIKMDVDNPEHVVTSLLEKLISASKRGVKVRLFLEQNYLGAFNNHIDSFNKSVKAYLESHSDIQVVLDLPDTTTHSKILITDNQRALIGSNNWYEKGILSHHQVGLVTSDSKAVRGLNRYFQTLLEKQQIKDGNRAVDFPNGGDNPLDDQNTDTKD